MKFLSCLLVVCLLGLTACNTRPKNAALMRMYLPASPAAPPARRVQVTMRTPAITLEVDSMAVLSESDLDHVDVIGEGENFAMRFFFNTHGTIKLDALSLNSRGQLIVVIINGVAVAAPQLRARIVDGVFQFTPDITRSEADTVTKGLNATVQYLNKIRK